MLWRIFGKGSMTKLWEREWIKRWGNGLEGIVGTGNINTIFCWYSITEESLFIGLERHRQFVYGTCYLEAPIYCGLYWILTDLWLLTSLTCISVWVCFQFLQRQSYSGFCILWGDLILKLVQRNILIMYQHTYANEEPVFLAPTNFKKWDERMEQPCTSPRTCRSFICYRVLCIVLKCLRLIARNNFVFYKSTSY